MLIGELSVLTGCNTHQLRYYETQNLLFPQRSRNGYRRYSEEAVDTVRSIRALLAVGLSTDEIRMHLPTMGRDADPDAWQALMPALRSRLVAVDEQVANLLESRRVIFEWFAQMQQTAASASPTAPTPDRRS